MSIPQRLSAGRRQFLFARDDPWQGCNEHAEDAGGRRWWAEPRRGDRRPAISPVARRRVAPAQRPATSDTARVHAAGPVRCERLERLVPGWADRLEKWVVGARRPQGPRFAILRKSPCRWVPKGSFTGDPPFAGNDPQRLAAPGRWWGKSGSHCLFPRFGRNIKAVERGKFSLLGDAIFRRAIDGTAMGVPKSVGSW